MIKLAPARVLAPAVGGGPPAAPSESVRAPERHVVPHGIMIRVADVVLIFHHWHFLSGCLAGPGSITSLYLGGKSMLPARATEP